MARRAFGLGLVDPRRGIERLGPCVGLPPCKRVCRAAEGREKRGPRVMDACADLLRFAKRLQLASRPSQRSSPSYGQSRKAPSCAVISCAQPGTQWAEPLRSRNRPRRLVMSTDERKRGEEKVNARQGTPSARLLEVGVGEGGDFLFAEFSRRLTVSELAVSQQERTQSVALRRSLSLIRRCRSR